MQPSYPPIPLTEAISAGATLVTVNNRLARHLLQRHEAAQSARGLHVWTTPRILPLSAWLAELHTAAIDRGLSGRTVLTTHQERLLWERVIRRAARGRELLQPAAAARAAQHSHRLAGEWGLTEADLGDGAGPETNTFLAWRRELERICAREGWSSAADLPRALTGWIDAGELPLPAGLGIAGFDDPPPALTRLLAAVQRRGCTVSRLEPDPAGDGAARYCTGADREQEIRLAALWARERLAADPEARIGVVAPALQEQHPRLRRIFTEVLHPELQWRDGDPEPLFNLSLGLPVSDYPVAHDALLALRLSTGAHPHADFAALLRSPYLGGGRSELEARARLDARLRRDGRPRLDRRRLERRLAEQADIGCPELARRLRAVDRLLAAAPSRAVPSAWAPRLLGLLAAWGWPGDRVPDSGEYQQASRLRALLEELAGLDRVLPPLPLDRAVGALDRLAGESLFQPERGTAPVQVLGILEAGGQRFDHLWLLGLDDQSWPPPPAPDPLLPAALQRRLGMPRASAQRELDFAARLTEQLLRAAPEVVVSHPRGDGDRPLGPSPLIAGMAEQAPPTAAAPAALDAWPEVPRAECESLDDGLAPPPGDRMGGGSELLSSQSACPFRALAGHRLRARPLDEVGYAPDPGMVGEQVHRILATVWGSLGSREGLLAADPVELEGRIRGAVDAVLAEAGRARPDLYPPAFTALERERLVELVTAWLDRERQRPPFRVERLEQREEIELGGLRLRLRADRVDAGEDGGLIVIDYKTGTGARPADWLAERLAEPQVPLYASHLRQAGQAVGAAAVARVRIDDRAGFVGLAEHADLLPGVKAYQPDGSCPDWDALLERWRRGLLALAEEIRTGRADPTPSPRACRYCPYPALCRLSDWPDEDDGEAARE